jgi:hypothetical protein
LIDCQEFRNCFAKASPEQQLAILDSIEQGDKDTLELWLRRAERKSIDELGVRDLRLIAAELGVYRYNQKSRGALLAAIEEAKRKRDIQHAERNRNTLQGDGISDFGSRSAEATL